MKNTIDTHRLRMPGLLAAVFVFSMTTNVLTGVEPGQIDDFQDGTTMGWEHGRSNPHEPRLAEDEGPDGTGDHALRVSSAGGIGPGSMMAMFNREQWTGDFVGAGIERIEFALRHVSGTDASIRLAVSDTQGPSGTWFASAEPVKVSSGTGWETYMLSLEPEDLTRITGGEPAESVLADVAEMRLLSAESPEFRGDTVEMELLFDNITALPDGKPAPVIVNRGITRENDIIRVEFASNLDAGAHRIESRADLGSGFEWSEIDTEAEELEPGIFRFEIAGPGTPRHFFRITSVAE